MCVYISISKNFVHISKDTLYCDIIHYDICHIAEVALTSTSLALSQYYTYTRIVNLQRVVSICQSVLWFLCLLWLWRKHNPDYVIRVISDYKSLTESLHHKLRKVSEREGLQGHMTSRNVKCLFALMFLCPHIMKRKINKIAFWEVVLWVIKPAALTEYRSQILLC